MKIITRKSVKLKNNFESIISNEELVACIKLLPNYKQYVLKNPILVGTNSKSNLGGAYNHKRKDIRIQKCSEYNSYNISTQKLVVVTVLIHELRHSYQNNSRKDFKKCIKSYRFKNLDRNMENPLEIDAYSFTSRFMKENKTKINKILHINDISWALDNTGCLTYVKD